MTSFTYFLLHATLILRDLHLTLWQHTELQELPHMHTWSVSLGWYGHPLGDQTLSLQITPKL